MTTKFRNTLSQFSRSDVYIGAEWELGRKDKAIRETGYSHTTARYMAVEAMTNSIFGHYGDERDGSIHADYGWEFQTGHRPAPMWMAVNSLATQFSKLGWYANANIGTATHLHFSTPSLSDTGVLTKFLDLYYAEPDMAIYHAGRVFHPDYAKRGSTSATLHGWDRYIEVRLINQADGHLEWRLCQGGIFLRHMGPRIQFLLNLITRAEREA